MKDCSVYINHAAILYCNFFHTNNSGFKKRGFSCFLGGVVVGIGGCCSLRG